MPAATEPAIIPSAHPRCSRKVAAVMPGTSPTMPAPAIPWKKRRVRSTRRVGEKARIWERTAKKASDKR